MFNSYLPKLIFLWEENNVFILLYQVLLGQVWEVVVKL